MLNEIIKMLNELLKSVSAGHDRLARIEEKLDKHHASVVGNPTVEVPFDQPVMGNSNSYR